MWFLFFISPATVVAWASAFLLLVQKKYTKEKDPRSCFFCGGGLCSGTPHTGRPCPGAPGHHP